MLQDQPLVEKPSVMTLSFRKMVTSDLEAVAKVEAQAHPFPWKVGHFRDALTAGNDTLIMEQAGQLIGYAIVMTVLDEAHLLNITVAKPFQRQGYGRQLMHQVIELALGKDCQNIFLEVRASNASAIGLYEAEGFNEMAIRRNYYPAKTGREDAVLMGLAI